MHYDDEGPFIVGLVIVVVLVLLFSLQPGSDPDLETANAVSQSLPKGYSSDPTWQKGLVNGGKYARGEINSLPARNVPRYYRDGFMLAAKLCMGDLEQPQSMQPIMCKKESDTLQLMPNCRIAKHPTSLVVGDVGYMSHLSVWVFQNRTVGVHNDAIVYPEADQLPKMMDIKGTPWAFVRGGGRAKTYPVKIEQTSAGICLDMKHVPSSELYYMITVPAEAQKTTFVSRVENANQALIVDLADEIEVE